VALLSALLTVDGYLLLLLAQGLLVALLEA
jgi:hypothetical protein